jgi:hypothetical protein
MQNIPCSVRTVKTPDLPIVEDDPCYEPTPRDWEDYCRHLAREESLEMMDREAEMERIRRADFDAARSAACVVRGIAAALGACGYDALPERLVRAAAEVEQLVTRYA